MEHSYADIVVAGRPQRLEFAWVGAARVDAPAIVFLHEGLGSLAMWKDFPQRLCDASAKAGIGKSNAGRGRCG